MKSTQDSVGSKTSKNVKNLSIITQTSNQSKKDTNVKSEDKVKPVKRKDTVKSKQEVLEKGDIEKSPPAVTKVKSHSDETVRCKSAMQYPYREIITERWDPCQSLPSSPLHMLRNENQVITSEVFTRTIDSSQSVDMIYRHRHSSSNTHSTADSKRQDRDPEHSFIETTDSSLSDSIALPSSSSDPEGDHSRRKQKAASPKPTKRTLTILDKRSELGKQSTVIEIATTSVSTTSTATSSAVVSTQGKTVVESKVSPILEFRSTTPPRVKHKFSYESDDTGKV